MYYLSRAVSSRQKIHVLWGAYFLTLAPVAGLAPTNSSAKGRLGACRPQDTRQSAETMYYLSRAVRSRPKIHVLWGADFLTLAPVAGLAPTNSSANIAVPTGLCGAGGAVDDWRTGTGGWALGGLTAGQDNVSLSRALPA